MRKVVLVEMSDLIALAAEGLAENFFRAAVGVDIGGVEEIDAGVEADVDELVRFGDVGCCTPGVEKLLAAAKCGGAKTQNGNLEAGASEQSIFHGG